MATQRGTGWRERQEAGKAKLSAGMNDALISNLRAGAERAQAERDALVVHEAETVRKRMETACPCPSCDGGKKVLTVDEAAFVASAVEHYRNHRYATDPEQVVLQYARIAHPDWIVVGKRVVPATAYQNDLNIGEHAAAQAPVIPAVETATAEEAAALAELVSETPRKKPRHVTPPHLDD